MLICLEYNVQIVQMGGLLFYRKLCAKNNGVFVLWNCDCQHHESSIINLWAWRMWYCVHAARLPRTILFVCKFGCCVRCKTKSKLRLLLTIWMYWFEFVAIKLLVAAFVFSAFIRLRLGTFCIYSSIRCWKEYYLFFQFCTTKFDVCCFDQIPFRSHIFLYTNWTTQIGKR